MLRVEPRGDDVFELVERDGRPVAFVRRTVVRVGAFETVEDAVRAAMRGDALTDAYVRGGPDRSPAGETAHVAGALGARGTRTGRERSARGDRGALRSHDVRLVHDGAYEWIVLRRRPIARLLRPGALAAPGGAPGATFALEFVLPEAIPVSMRLTIARALHGAVGAPARTDPPPPSAA